LNIDFHFIIFLGREFELMCLLLMVVNSDSHKH
jgi:hypothetical protein